MRLPFENRVNQAAYRGRYRLFAVLACVMLVIIFAFSLVPMQESAEQSGWLLGFIQQLTGLQMDELVLRKLAHFTEYALLGFFLGGALSQMPFRKQDAALAFLFCFVVAFLDESLQMLTGRGPAIIDVWIDCFGALCGLLLALMLFHLLYRHKQKNRPKAG